MKREGDRILRGGGGRGNGGTGVNGARGGGGETCAPFEAECRAPEWKTNMSPGQRAAVVTAESWSKASSRGRRGRSVGMRVASASC